MTTVDRAADIQTRLKADMLLTFSQCGLDPEGHLIDALVQDAMFQVEALLAEMEKDREHDHDRG